MKIVVFGGGSFGTALANQLSYNETNEVTILLRNPEIEAEINQFNTNATYFPNRKLHTAVHASCDKGILQSADILLIAIPTKSILSSIGELQPYLNPGTLIVNMAKGIFDNGQTIVEYLKAKLEHDNVVTLKGASFSSEMLDRNATLMTLGFEKKEQFEKIKASTLNTNIYLDFTTDIKGVELLSALKNIYAILIGNIDAKFNSANSRFLFLTKAISEIKIILNALGGREDTLFLSCGIGDTCLTSLNDLSRNRTLGLLIGKGFYNSLYNDNSVVLEGIKTLNFINTVISSSLKRRLPLLSRLVDMFIEKKGLSLHLDFDSLFQNNYKTVLTYGTFDLLHFGHLEILRRAKEMGDRLIVALSTDEFNLGKGKACEVPYENRKQCLEAIQYVDLVIPETRWEQKKSDVLNYNVDIFVMGDDWTGKFDELKDYCEVVYLPRTKGISTTALKMIINA